MVEEKVEELEEILENPWDNVYWFARWLIDTDRYGAPGRNSKLMLSISAEVREKLSELRDEDEETAVETLYNVICNLILSDRDPTTKIYRQLEVFCRDIHKKILTRKDVEVFALTCERVMVPINRALEIIPNDDYTFAESVASVLLTTKKEEGLKTVISIWDDLGLHGCLTAERTQVVEAFKALREHLNEHYPQRDIDIILTAFIQEFERRLLQKRKGRAGRSLEDVTTFILQHFHIKAVHVPTHITASLELDRLVSCKDGTYIGISCKRTFRERWKQAFTSDMKLLNQNKIKALWHALTFDRDLSNDKIEEIGKHRGIIYLPDDSPRFKEAIRNPKIKGYVRPLSHFIEDIELEIG
jgi:hypothetical protein